MRLSDAHRTKLAGLLKKYDQVKGSLVRLEGRAKKLREKEEVSGSARVNALSVVHSGVSFAVAGTTLEILGHRGIEWVGT